MFELGTPKTETPKVYIESSTIDEHLQIASVSTSEVYLKNTNVSILSIEDTARISSFECFGCNIHGISIDANVNIGVFTMTVGAIKSLEFQGTIEKVFLSLSIGTLGIPTTKAIKEVIIEECNIQRFHMTDVIDSELSIVIYDSQIQEEWHMEYSLIKELKVFNMRFSQNSKLYFDNTILTAYAFSNIIWPKGFKLYSYVEEPTEAHRSLKETYKQLKQAMIRDGNYMDALAFYHNEMEEYRAFVKGNDLVKGEDKFILFISWLFSNHGQSFVRPLAWLLGMHLLFFFIAIGLNYNDFYFTWPHEWASTWGLVGSYFYLLNPVHKLPDVSGGMLILDFFMRLSSGFFIYHIIRASRKFAKV